MIFIHQMNGCQLTIIKNEKQKIKRLAYLKKELDAVMPAVITSVAVGYYPANY